MKNYPFYKQSFWLTALIPVISYGCFTAAERIFVAENTSNTQKVLDDLTLAMVASIATLLNCDNLEAMSIISLIERGEPTERKEAAAYDLAAIENRQKPQNVVYEQFTFFINSRLDREKFNAAAFEQQYKVSFTGEWTIEHTMAVVNAHTAIDAFIANESGNVKINDPEEMLSAGEHFFAAESA